jgi:hypothetical protein
MAESSPGGFLARRLPAEGRGFGAVAFGALGLRAAFADTDEAAPSGSVPPGCSLVAGSLGPVADRAAIVGSAEPGLDSSGAGVDWTARGRLGFEVAFRERRAPCAGGDGAPGGSGSG